MTIDTTGPAAGSDPSRPLPTWRGRVRAKWIDYNGHMTEHRYLQCFGDATDGLLRFLGMDAAYLASGRSFYTVETHLRHLGEAALGTELAVRTQVLGGDAKRVHVFHSLERTADRSVIATAEHMLLHVDTRASRATPAKAPMLQAITAERIAPRPLT